jgi:hypothetical protein
MQALRQVLTPMGTFNCPAHRGVEKARIGGADAWADEAMAKQTGEPWADEAMAKQTGERLKELMDRFDASIECRDVTCVYNGVNWWLEKMVEDPREAIELDTGDERQDFFF